ncbi:alanine racemase [Candidatus Woesebacteria bacterium]|nr:alanine racemase [Candidatus Woesebacteria bacterium]
MHLRTWIEISKKDLLSNLLVLKRRVGRAKVASVVKANAYGHGLREVASILKGKTDLFAVDSYDEAKSVKEVAVNNPILILGYVPRFLLKEVIDEGFSFVVYNLEILKKIDALSLNKKAKIHLKIETGLNRQGIGEEDLLKILLFIKKKKEKFEVKGISTHFANIEDTLDPSFAKFQLTNFKKALKMVRSYGFNPKYVHTAASAGAILYPETHLNMVRVGISLYGIWPSRETKIIAKSKKTKIVLKPVLSWKSVIAQTKNLAKGDSVGYGRAWIASRKSKIAVVPVGYADGLDRKLSNTGRVIIRGKSAPIIGRVAMNMIMIDVTEIPKVSLEDEVIIVGTQGKQEILVEEIAEKIGTINYEVLSRINPNLPRIIV